MQAPLTRRILNRNCRHCGIKYSQKHIENIFGKDSAPAILGYCSASCYTKSLTEAGTKIPNNTNECKNELGIPFNYEAQKIDKGNWVLPIEILGKGKVAQAYGETKKECKANAQCIIKSVNMHDDLVKENEELKEWKEQQIKLTAPILEFMGNNSDKFNLRVGDSIFKKVLEILKQEEEK